MTRALHRRHRPRRRALSAWVAVAAALVGTIAIGSPTSSQAASADSFTTTKTVTRTFQDTDDQDQTTQKVVDSRDVTVDVDKTTNLRGRERVQVSWKGAHPSAARATDPYGENGLNQEYPVVVMQCRGVDDSTAPAAQQISPSTCWTSTWGQRSVSTTKTQAIWRHDLYGSAADTAQKGGITPFPSAAKCPDVASFSTHYTAFVTASGKTYDACNSDQMPPEAAVDSTFPPAEIAAYTDLAGKGDVNFEVRSDQENASLGCSQTVKCAIVVIPIEGLSCSDADTGCRATGQFAPGSSNFAGYGVDAAVSSKYWWSASNWRNRITVPITFGPAPNVCDVLDHRTPVPFYGSELMAQATLQWAPAYCLDKNRFKFQANNLPDDAAYSLMQQGQVAAAFVSGQRDGSASTPVGYAPTAVTGFAVSFIIDKPNNGGELTRLRLDPRLLAKLLTQSYTGSTQGRTHPGMVNNPLSINQDPEFQALNPGLDTYAREAAATVLSLSTSSDVITSLTSYIENDPEARDFIAGTADPWGMVVNPSYRGIALPISEWPLNDQFKPTTNLACQKQNETPYFNQIAAPVSSLRTIAEAVLDAWPNVQTACTRASSSDPYKFGRIDRQGMGTRFMLGITSLGDAKRYGLDTASLQTKVTSGSGTAFTSDAGRTFVAPTDASMAAAVRTATPSKDDGAFGFDEKKLVASTTAYPGTMVVYTAARLSGLNRTEASQVSRFIKIATSEGQRPGSGNGQLPDGFLPLTPNGATAAMWKQAQTVADLVAEQKPLPSTASSSSGSSLTGAAATSDAPTKASTAQAGAPATQVVKTVPTAATTSSTARVLLPLLVLGCLLGMLGAPVLKLVSVVGGRRA